MKNLTPNQAAAQAFQLFSQEAKLCEAHPSKVPRTQGKPAVAENCNEPESEKRITEDDNEPVPSNSNLLSSESHKETDSSKAILKGLFRKMKKH